jgi:hypothetical protein
VKRRDLLKRIRAGAKAAGVTFGQVREGANHTIFAVGRFEFTVPRHTEINEYTAQEILKDLESELGEGWWRQ